MKNPVNICLNDEREIVELAVPLSALQLFADAAEIGLEGAPSTEDDADAFRILEALQRIA